MGKSNSQICAQAAGGIISASLLSMPGASGFYKGGLTVRNQNGIVTSCGWSADEY
jgi:nicotinamide mononucleotide (NMN) deamidase PncC